MAFVIDGLRVRLRNTETGEIEDLETGALQVADDGESKIDGAGGDGALPRIGQEYPLDLLPALGEERVIECYEGPLLSTFKSPRSGEFFVQTWCDADSTLNRWILFRSTDRDLTSYLKRRISLRELMMTAKDGLVWLLDTAQDQTRVRASISRLERLPASYLPSEDSFHCEAKPGSKAKPKPKPKPKDKDKDKPKQKAKPKPKIERKPADDRRFDRAVYRAIEEGAHTVAAIRRSEDIEADSVQVLAALGRLLEREQIVQIGTGRKANYQLPGVREDTVGPYLISSDTFESGIAWDDQQFSVYLFPFKNDDPDEEAIDALTSNGIPKKDLPAVLKVLKAHALALDAVPPPDESDDGAPASEPTPPRPPPPPPPPPPIEEVTLPKADLKWIPEVLKNRETFAAAWDQGAFRIVQKSGGVTALYYEHQDGHVYDYGCGGLKALKTLATRLAEAGLPTPADYRAAGGDLNACPRPRRVRLGESELTWRETVEGDTQLCVAAVGDGEFKLLQSEGGSFMLVFARAGDPAFDTLGCGTREALERRALDVLGQLTSDDDDTASTPAAPKRPTKKKPAQRPKKEAKTVPPPTTEPPSPPSESPAEPTEDQAKFENIGRVIKNAVADLEMDQEDY
jgi:hypothetical protein